MRYALCFGCLVCSFALFAQKTSTDTSSARQLSAVVVTATRNERTLGALPMPVTLVSKAQIRLMGSLRLTDVLNEQTGLVSVPQVNGIGNGLQLQGFDPDYTLILIDGEPLIGRFTGSLDLSRVTVGNIKQIEIVKGPSSSLYGSDALAGVVNIITERPVGMRANVYSRYGTNNTRDLSGDFGVEHKNLGVYVFGNRYSTAGYNLVPGTFGKTVSPFQNYTLNAKVYYKFSPTAQFSVSGRYFEEHQQNQYAVDSVQSVGTGLVKDWNLNPVLVQKFKNKLKTTLRLYTTRYQTNSELHNAMDGSFISEDDFLQTFLRPEINGEYFFNAKNILTVGTGMVHETVQTDRYGDENKRVQDTRYGFFQHEWDPSHRLSMIFGGRYDNNTIYGSQFSPKFSTRYVLNSWITLKGSMGVGFKSPDFRQLYLNFTNAAGGGYSVFGTEVAKEKLNELNQEGQIAYYLSDPSQIGNLKAERSASYNLGAKINFTSDFFADINFFRNNVRNLINYYEVAVTKDDKAIYSYQNLNRIYTDGIESNFAYNLFPGLTASLGYQLLYAKDKDVIAQIKSGEVYWRDPTTLESYKLKPSEYFGLYNRSRHMGNVKLFYENKSKGYSASLRVIYRGKFGIGSTFGNIQGSSAFTSGNNGNDILDVHDTFVPGYALVNISVGKTLLKAFRTQFGVDNIFNHTDPQAIPNLPGRLMYVSLAYTFLKKPVTN
jgi:outer membrane receptor for ferrienterochelin and colicins